MAALKDFIETLKKQDFRMRNVGGIIYTQNHKNAPGKAL